jgi:recombination protein RecA
MLMKSTALRAQLERILAGRYPAPFDFRERGPAETVPTSVPAIDAVTGGFPRGALTEIVGPASSGRTSLLLAALAVVTAGEEACALVDAQDTFDPHSAELAGVCLEHLLWVRCQNLDQALRATDLLLAGGGFSLVVVDLGDVPPRIASRVPLACWFRFRRLVEHSPTVLAMLEPASYAKTCASLVLRVEPEKVCWSSREVGNSEEVPHACLLGGARLVAEIARWREFVTHKASFETRF